MKTETVTPTPKDRIRVLFAEDDDMIREVTTMALRREGYDVVAVNDGAEAIAALPILKPDIIISDVRMPICDGFAFLQHVRRDPRFSLTPFIIISARADTADQRMGMSLGAEDYVTKPFQPEDLLKTIAIRLERATTIRRLQQEQQRFLCRVLPHELRTPLVGIMGYAELLTQIGGSGETLGASQLLDFGENLLRSGKRLLKLTEDISLWAWLEGQSLALREGKQADLVAQDVVPAQLEHACRLCESDHGRGGDLTFRTDPGRIRCLEDGFTQVVQNLVENAFKFSLPGKPVVVSGGVSGDYYLIEIIDRGRGMKPEQVTQISTMRQFDRERFEQQGLGMGLAIARAFAELSGGRLELAPNADGVGLAARLWIPFAKA